jgi:hypothetical protein
MLVNLAKKKNWQWCPKCRIYVARNRGCNTISCRLYFYVIFYFVFVNI